ncbi:MAG: hypothetical protein AAF604_04660 [Acidobacteriota bacterium]
MMETVEVRTGQAGKPSRLTVVWRGSIELDLPDPLRANNAYVRATAETYEPLVRVPALLGTHANGKQIFAVELPNSLGQPRWTSLTAESYSYSPRGDAIGCREAENEDGSLTSPEVVAAIDAALAAESSG